FICIVEINTRYGSPCGVMRFMCRYAKARAALKKQLRYLAKRKGGAKVLRCFTCAAGDGARFEAAAGSVAVCAARYGQHASKDFVDRFGITLSGRLH
ncbi:hypothetical protein NPIL_200391, partial [Nephila pilipes]